MLNLSLIRSNTFKFEINRTTYSSNRTTPIRGFTGQRIRFSDNVFVSDFRKANKIKHLRFCRALIKNSNYYCSFCEAGVYISPAYYLTKSNWRQAAGEFDGAESVGVLSGCAFLPMQAGRMGMEVVAARNLKEAELAMVKIVFQENLEAGIWVASSGRVVTALEKALPYGWEVVREEAWAEAVYGYHVVVLEEPTSAMVEIILEQGDVKRLFILATLLPLRGKRWGQLSGIEKLQLVSFPEKLLQLVTRVYYKRGNLIEINYLQEV